MSNRETRELAEIEGQIATLEAEISGMEAEMNDPALFVKLGAATSDYIARLDGKKAELELKFSRWAELEEIKAQCAAAAV